MKQSEAPESRRARMFLMFSDFRRIISKDFEQKEAALRWVSSRGAESLEGDALLSTGMSTDEVPSLGKSRSRPRAHFLRPRRRGR